MVANDNRPSTATQPPRDANMANPTYTIHADNDSHEALGEYHGVEFATMADAEDAADHLREMHSLSANWGGTDVTISAR